MKAILEVNEETNEVFIAKVNDDGFITHEVLIGAMYAADELIYEDLNAIAKASGWCIVEGAEWSPGDEWGFIEAEQLTTPVSFVGEVLPENHFELAKHAGVPVAEFVRAEKVEGKPMVRARYLTESDVLWNWGEPTLDSVAAGIAP